MVGIELPIATGMYQKKILISQPKNMLCVLKMNLLNEHLKHISKLMGKNSFFICLSKVLNL